MEYYISYVINEDRYYVTCDNENENNPRYYFTQNWKEACPFYSEWKAYMTIKEKIIPILPCLDLGEDYTEKHFEIVVASLFVNRKYDTEGNRIFL